MPRMSKRDKAENAFFLTENGRIKYNEKCVRCMKECKQSYRAKVICCPIYQRKY